MEYKSSLFYLVLITFVCGQEDVSDNDFLSRVSPRAAETLKTGSTFCTADITQDTYFCNYGCTKGAQAYQCSGTVGSATASTDVAHTCVADSDTPYCNVGAGGTSATCTDIPDPNCLKCPTTGFFPDFQNCSRYYECTIADIANGIITASQKTCPGGQYFNPLADSHCSRGYCVKPRCTGKAAEWRPFNYRSYTYNHFGLYCEDGEAKFIEACPAGLSLDITKTATKKCYLRCTYSSSGNRGVDINDNTKYLECTKGIAVTKSCPSGQTFKPETLMCSV